MKKDREKIKAVSDDKLIDLLKNINLYDDVIIGKIKCKFCGETAKIECISAIFPDSGSIKVACDSPKCIAGLNNFLNQKI
ncbi:MAG TPA: hypothetical protein VLZ83_09425 [Edaphocola sp.]|nr:hypothetical protein [Edaphocola sp.]